MRSLEEIMCLSFEGKKPIYPHISVYHEDDQSLGTISSADPELLGLTR